MVYIVAQSNDPLQSLSRVIAGTFLPSAFSALARKEEEDVCPGFWPPRWTTHFLVILYLRERIPVSFSMMQPPKQKDFKS